jgi:mycothiol system anti-sigma-R factor
VITCAEAVKQLWEYLENEVAPEDRASVEEHLAFCRKCCGEVEFADELRTMLASSAAAELPPSVEARLAMTLDQLTQEGDPS